MSQDSPLGQATTYPDDYSPDLLYAIARIDSRLALGLEGDPPFNGMDIWNAWDLTWLDMKGQPQVATAEIRVPADSVNLVESKSLKLYLGSVAMSRFESPNDLAAVLSRDLGACTGSDVYVAIRPSIETDSAAISRLPGQCIDNLKVPCDTFSVAPELLAADSRTLLSEDLYTDTLRSLCPVTGQPDIGSVMISYRGPQIDRAGLLRYIVSYRQHQDFHESCVERMFMDIREQCGAEQLTVYARYQRRGGIDINPFRSNFEATIPNTRLWRQ
jgi:7-cyano-7-deazaguanine reductase